MIIWCSLFIRLSQLRNSYQYQISDTLLSKWRQHFMDNAANLFVAEHNHKNASNARIAELERLVGQLTLELSASKKVLSYFDSR